MSEHVEQDVTTQTGVAAGGTISATVDTQGADRVHIIIDDGAGNSPAAYTYETDVVLNGNGDSQPGPTGGGSNSGHHEETAIPFEWTVTLTNDSGGAADYRLRVISIEE